MVRKNHTYFIQVLLASAITAFITKDLLTPLILAGRDFSNRSPLAQALILLILTTVYFVLIIKLFPILRKWVSTRSIAEPVFFAAIMLITVAIMGADLLKPGMISGYDTDYHLLRIESLSEGIRLRQVPVRINPLFLNGYGYASSLFYPDLFLYFPAVLRALGLSITLSAKIFLVVIFVMTFLSAYWCGKIISKSHDTGLIASIVYSLTQYFLLNVYIRGALGEVQAYVFLPLVIAGLYSLFFDQFEKYWLLALGFIGLFYSHLISMLIAAFLVAGVSIFRVRTILMDKVRMERIGKFLVITLLATISFWLPLIEQFRSGSFQFSQSTYMARSSAVALPVIFAATRKFTSNHVAFGLQTLVLCLTWFAARKLLPGKAPHPFAAWGLGISAVLLFMVSDKFPWEWFSGPLNIIQFPWRLYSFAAVFIAFAAAILIASILPQNLRRVSVFVLVIFLGIPAVWVGRSQHRELPPDHYHRDENTFYVNNGEWLPVQTDLDALETKDRIVLDNNGQEVAYTQSGQELLITPESECAYLDVPLIYYVGYSAHQVDEQGYRTGLALHPLSVDHTIRVDCPPDATDGTVRVAYTGTLVQHASLYVNLLVVLAIGWIKRYKPDWLV